MMNVLRTTARIAARPVRISAPLRTRSFSRTPVWRASEDSESFMAGLKNSPMFTQMAENPEVLTALSKMAEFLKKNDFDMSVPVSRMTLFKLATNSEFRELARNAMTEMQKAGIDIKAEHAMELFSSTPDQPKGPK